MCAYAQMYHICICITHTHTHLGLEHLAVALVRDSQHVERAKHLYVHTQRFN